MRLSDAFWRRLWTYFSGRQLYPAAWDPSQNRSMPLTQTIQLTAYFAAAASSVIWLARIHRWRTGRLRSIKAHGEVRQRLDEQDAAG